MNTLFLYIIKVIIGTLPQFFEIAFYFTVILTIILFYRAANRSKTVLTIILIWLIIQGVLASTGFYLNNKTIPPRLVLIGIPPLIFIIFLFLTKKGRVFIDSLNDKALTILHVIRIPMEIVLWWLFINNTIPEIMTFEGRNFDIIIGITVPIIYYLGYVKKVLSKSGLLIWNVVGVLLLANIVFYAILSIETNFQQFGFKQPNEAVLHFPYVWLPCCVVPIVFLSHFAVIRKLLKN